MSTTIPEVKPKEIKAPVYSEAERIALNGYIEELCRARNQRDMPHPELDGMTYVEWYDSNKRKDLSYIPPKKKRSDIRVVTGHTRHKDTTLLSTMLNMNLQPDITAFDTEDMVVNELGDNMAALVQKSREIEIWEKKRPIVYREMIAQGDVFVQEIHVDDFREMPLSQVDWDPTKGGISEFSFNSRLKNVFSGCASRMVNGKKIYLGNIRTEYIEDQDMVAVLNLYSRQEAFSRYGTWERWANVPTTVDTTTLFSLDGTTYKSWNLVTLNNDDQVAEIMIYQPKKNRFQILLNGVMMLPHDYPFTALFPSGEIPIAQGKLEPISDFAYSKSQPSNVKIDQEVLDETTKLMIEGMRQGRKPPMGNRSKRIFGSNIFMAGKVTPDLPEGSLYPLLQNAGLNNADFSFYKLIKDQLDEKTVNASYSGGPQQGDPTATQVQQEKEQQMLALGASLDGVVNLERRMTWNRLYNILTNYTTPTDQQVDDVRGGIKKTYRSFAVNTTVEDGQNGIKMFRFKNAKDYPPMADHIKEEQGLSDHYGKPVRIVYLDPDELRQMKFTWYIVINPTPKSSDKLSQILFVQHVREAMELFGPDSLNLDYVKQRYSIIINEDYSKFFKKVDVMQMLQEKLGIANGGGVAPAQPPANGAAPTNVIPSKPMPSRRGNVMPATMQ